MDNQNNQNNLIGQAKQYDEKIAAINTQFFSALDDFKKYYVYYHKNPEVNEFQNYFANSKGQLQTLSNNLLTTTNAINKNINTLNSNMILVSAKLENEKKLNKELTKVLTNLENTQNGSEILIDNSKFEYNEQHYYNWELIAGIVIVGGLLSKLFAPTNGTAM
jgi:hypothetical protein